MANNAEEIRSSDARDREFKTFRVKELHPTFCAEIEGVEFPNPSDEQFEELLRAMAKVSAFNCRLTRTYRTSNQYNKSRVFFWESCDQHIGRTSPAPLLICAVPQMLFILTLRSFISSCVAHWICG